MARAGRTLVKVLVGVVAAVVVLVVALALVLQSSAVSSRVKDLVVPRASAALGREVTVRDAKLRILPNPHVSLAGAAIAGRAGEPPLVQLESFEVGLALWPLVTSLGKDVQVTGIRLVKPVVNLVRAKDGTWNYQGLGGEKEAQQPAPAPKEEASQRSVVVDHASISDGTVQLVDALTGGGAAVAVSKIEFAADHVGLGHPLDARLSAALVNPDKNFDAELHVSELPASAAALKPGSYPTVSGKVNLSGLDLGRLRAFLPPKVTGMMTGGRVEAQAALSTKEARYHVDGSGKLSQVRLRGEPAEGGFQLHASVDPATGAGRVAIDQLGLKGPGVDLGGQLTADLEPPRARFAIAGPLLDLGQVMGLLPPSAPKPKQQGPLLTAEQRRSARQADVAGTIDIAKVVRGGLTLTNFKANAALERGVFVLRDAHADAYGGRVDASGTRVDLGQEQPSWNLKAKLDSVDLGQALTSVSGAAPVVGKMAGSLDLDGAGVDWPTLQKALTGHGAIQLRDGALTTTDIGGQVLGAVAKGLQAAGKSTAAAKVGGAEGRTKLQDLAAQFTVKDGAMALSSPLTVTTPFGGVKLGGKIGLGGDLALQGNAILAKDALASIAGGTGLPVASGLEVPLGLGGTLGSPAVHVDAGQAVAGLVTGAAKQQAQKLGQEAQERAGRAVRRGLGDVLRGFGK